MNKIILKGSDGQVFEVDEAVAMESQTIKHMIEDDCTESGVPIPKVTGTIPAMVIEYCKKHVEAKPDDDNIVDKSVLENELKTYDTEFMKIDQATLYYVMLAANYLDIRGLLDLTCPTVANIMRGKTPDEIRKAFNIKNDFTPEEEEDIKRENQWAFEWSQTYELEIVGNAVG